MGLAVTIVLDDASDPEQVRTLIPERSDSLVLVTAREPLELPSDLPAHVHELPVEALDSAGAEELLDAAAQDSSGPYDADAADRIRELCGGLPLALSIAGSSLGPRSSRQLATDLGAYGPVEPIERVLWLRYTDQSDTARRLLRRLALAGRASLGGAAAASLLATNEGEATRHLVALSRAGLIDHVRGNRFRLHDLVRAFAQARLLDEEEPSERTAAQERLIVNYADLAESVLRLVDGNMSTRSDRFSPHGFTSLDEALRWLDDESSFITADAAARGGREPGGGAEPARRAVRLLPAARRPLPSGRDQRAGAGRGPGPAGPLGAVAHRYRGPSAGRAGQGAYDADVGRRSVHGGPSRRGRGPCPVLPGDHPAPPGQSHGGGGEAAGGAGSPGGPELATDRGWTMHALAAVERDRGHVSEALHLLTESLILHHAGESVHGEAWAHFQLGQLSLRMGDVPRAESELRAALDRYGRTRDARGEAWALTQLARARLVAGDASPAVDGLRQAASRHRENEDARGEAWTVYYLGQALEETGNLDHAVRELERSRTMFSRMRDVYGLACARHHSARATRDQQAARTGSLRNSGFARQLLVDARADFQRIGVAHGEAWTCLELAVVDAGNARTQQALALCDEAVDLFTSYGDRRGEDWARFLRCTLLPYAAPGGVEVGTAVAQEELTQLSRTSHSLRDEKLDDYAEAYQLLLERGVNLEAGWQAWRLGMVPSRHAREVMGVAVPATH